MTSYTGYNVTTTNPGNELIIATFIVCIFCFFLGSFVLPGYPLVKLVEKWFIARNDNLWAKAQSEKSEKSLQNQLELNYKVLQEEENHEEQLLKTRAKNPRSTKRYGGISSSNSVKKVKIEKVKQVNGGASRNEKVKHKRKKDGGKEKKEVRLKQIECTRVGQYEEKLDFRELFLMNDMNSIETGETWKDSSCDKSYGSDRSSQIDSSSLVESDSRDESILKEIKKMWKLVLP